MCEKIKLLTRQSCIHAFEKLVELEHFGGGHTGVFLRVGKRFLHFGVSVDGLTSGQHQPRNGGHHSHYGRLAVVQPVVEPLPPCLPDSHLRVDLGDFSLKQLDFSNLHIPRSSAALYAVKLGLQGAQGLVKLPGCRPVHSGKHLLGGLGRGLQFLNKAVGLFKFLLQFRHRGLISGGRGFRQFLLQFRGLGLQAFQHLLGLLAVDR